MFMLIYIFMFMSLSPCSTFTEEAERHCKGGQEILEEGLTVSGQGLVYNFESAQYGSYKVRLFTPRSQLLNPCRLLPNLMPY
jgi:hypothetical protein